MPSGMFTPILVFFFCVSSYEPSGRTIWMSKTRSAACRAEKKQKKIKRAQIYVGAELLNLRSVAILKVFTLVFPRGYCANFVHLEI